MLLGVNERINHTLLHYLGHARLGADETTVYEVQLRRHDVALPALVLVVQRRVISHFQNYNNYKFY